MDIGRKNVLAISALCVLVMLPAISFLAGAGPLQPPEGPIGDTGPSLGDFFDGESSLGGLKPPTGPVQDTRPSLADLEVLLLANAARLEELELQITGSLTADAAFPVGSVYISLTGVDPSSELGFGSWETRGQGRFLAGVGTGTDSKGEMRTLSAGNDPVGTYTHTLNMNEIPAHDHGPLSGGRFQIQGGSGDGSFLEESTPPTDRTNTASRTDSAGGGMPHENCPPAFAMYVWERVS